MTGDEAEQGAAKRHEFRTYVDLFHGEAVTWECWCGKLGPTLPSRVAADSNHERHQANAALQRAYR